MSLSMGWHQSRVYPRGGVWNADRRWSKHGTGFCHAEWYVVVVIVVVGGGAVVVIAIVLVVIFVINMSKFVKVMQRKLQTLFPDTVYMYLYI